MKKILVPTDFSPCAGNALSVAVQVAAKAGAELYLLHLETVPDLTVHAGGLLSAAGDQENLRQCRAELFNLADEVEHQGIKVHTVLVEDETGEKITDYILPYGIDLIVMGTHGHKGFTGRILGSMARKVVRQSKVPVMVIHDLPGNGLQFHNILFASTFRKDQSAAIRAVVDLVNLFGGTLHVLYLNLYYHLIREETARETVETLLAPWPKLARTVTVTETNEESWGIRNFSRLAQADLIAVSMDHQTLPGRLLNPTAAERLIDKETLPLLILPAG